MVRFLEFDVSLIDGGGVESGLSGSLTLLNLVDGKTDVLTISLRILV
jgi:hypothetical protein